MLNIQKYFEEKKEIRYKIKSFYRKIDEIKRVLLPSKGQNAGSSGGAVKTSPQEKLVIKIDSLFEKIVALEKRDQELDKLIDEELLKIHDPQYRYIFKQRLSGMSWKEIDSDGLSESSVRRIVNKCYRTMGKEGEPNE